VRTGLTVTAPDALAADSCAAAGGVGRLGEIGVSHANPVLRDRRCHRAGVLAKGPSPVSFMHFDHAEIEEGPMGSASWIGTAILRRALMDAVRRSAERAVMEWPNRWLPRRR